MHKKLVIASLGASLLLGLGSSFVHAAAQGTQLSDNSKRYAAENTLTKAAVAKHHRQEAKREDAVKQAAENKAKTKVKRHAVAVKHLKGKKVKSY